MSELMNLLIAQGKQTQSIQDLVSTTSSMSQATVNADDDEEEENVADKKQANALPVWGNKNTMNLNPMILTNIQASPYFKVNLFDLKTYHQVIDEIYYKVTHLEPWEKGSRNTAGQTGMCGGVRGVAAGGVVSSSYCLLFKLYTLKLTRKQAYGLLDHCDSPYIRGLGFMYLRYSQPPGDLFDWFYPYLEDEEEIDVKAGGGCNITIGELVYMLLTKLEWYGTMFPRIPVPIQKQINERLEEWKNEKRERDRAEEDKFKDEEREKIDSDATHNKENDESRSKQSPQISSQTMDRHHSRSRDSRSRDEEQRRSDRDRYKDYVDRYRDADKDRHKDDRDRYKDADKDRYRDDKDRYRDDRDRHRDDRDRHRDDRDRHRDDRYRDDRDRYRDDRTRHSRDKDRHRDDRDRYRSDKDRYSRNERDRDSRDRDRYYHDSKQKSYERKERSRDTEYSKNGRHHSNRHSRSRSRSHEKSSGRR